MRTVLFARGLAGLGLAAACAIAIAIGPMAGCTRASHAPDRAAPSDDARATSLGEERLVGGYHATGGAPYPRLTLASDRTYDWDTGIRCIRAPCPSGDVGRWRLYARDGGQYVGLSSNDGAIGERSFAIAADGARVTLTGAFGTSGAFEKDAPDGGASAGAREEERTCPPPGNVDCFPGPEKVIPKACEPKTRAWIVDRCPGVTFTD